MSDEATTQKAEFLRLAFTVLYFAVLLGGGFSIESSELRGSGGGDVASSPR